jgi:hypothetical protein
VNPSIETWGGTFVTSTQIEFDLTWEGEDESDFNEGGRERGFKKANATKYETYWREGGGRNLV